MNNASELLSHFSNVKDKGGGKYTCDCPICNRKEHVYISIERDSAAMFCQGCKADGKQLAAAVGLKAADLFFKEHTAPLPRRTHYYYFADGSLFGKKEIVKKPDGSKNCFWRRYENGSYVKGLKGAKAPLYNLKELAATSETVYFAEGEKDCDTLSKMGLTATSTPNGANQKSWLDSFSEHLVGRDIVVLTDNDAPGAEYGEFIARNVKNVAASVKIIPALAIYPEVAPKGDISDIVAAIGIEAARQKVAELTQTMTEWQEPEAEADEKDEVPNFFDNGRFMHNIMGDYLVKQNHACKIYGVVHIYENGIYVPGEELLQGYIIKLLPSLTDQKRREVLKYIKVSLDTPTAEPSPPNLVPFKSRVYDIKTDKFLDYSPDMVFLCRFPYDYKPDAPKQELVANVLRDIACGDMEIVKLLLEAIGYCFYRENIYRGCIMLHGPNGSNGKSTLLNMIIQLLGDENVSKLSLKDINDKFRLMHIYGKVANIGDDISSQYFEESEIFKKLVTGQFVTAEHKGQDSVQFRNYAKLFFAANELPKTADKSDAFLTRILPVPMLADFSKREDCDISLKDRHWTDEEMEYLLAISMEGLKRLMRNNGFTIPECVTKERKQYEIENNSVLAFLEDNPDIAGMPTNLAHAKFIDWCRMTGNRGVVSRTKFTREVCKATGLVSRNRRTSVADESKVVKCFVVADNVADCA